MRLLTFILLLLITAPLHGQVSRVDKVNIKAPFITCMISDGNDGAYIGTEDQGVFHYNKEGRKYYGHAFEIKGEVKPSDFRSNIDIARDVVGMSTEKPTNAGRKLMVLEKYQHFSDDEGANDTSISDFKHNRPPTIYDLDMPASQYYLFKNRGDSNFLRVFNAKQWAVYGDNRCSDIVKFSIRYDFRFKNGIETKCWSDLTENQFYTIEVKPDDQHNEFVPMQE